MVKYFCNKCGCEVKSALLKIVTQDDAGAKKNYHLCSSCTGSF